MPEGQVLEFSGVTKRFGAVTAVDDITARIEPGVVTGFLGPNGAGKTTTLRMLLGLVKATSGTATIGGVPYAQLSRPLQTVGAVLEASSFHPGRTAANHLRVYARAAGISNERVDEVLGLVGLADAAGRKVGGFSLGMRQRLGLASALLGDPGVLVLDEPANGLDPEGIRWMRGFLRQLAGEGRTVLVSSHLLTEVQQTVDSLVVIAQGRVVFQGGLEDLADPSEYATVVDAPDRAGLVAALEGAGVSFEVLRSGLTVRGLDPVDVGAIAAAAGVALSSLQRRGPALEEVFLQLVSGERVHTGATAPPADEPVVEPVVEESPAAQAIPIEDASVEEPAVKEPAVEPESAPEAGREVAPPPVAATAAFAVASTGVIDIIPPDTVDDPVEASPAGEMLREDADPDVEAIGAIDEELQADAADARDDEARPFDSYEKTDADHDADAFFAAFDDGEGAPADDAPDDTGEPGPSDEGDPR